MGERATMRTMALTAQRERSDAMSHATSTRRRGVLVFVIAALALGLHTFAALRMAPGGDEPVYVRAGYHYALDIRQGHPERILHEPYNTEHPALARLLFAGAILVDWSIHGYQPLSATDEAPTSSSQP